MEQIRIKTIMINISKNKQTETNKEGETSQVSNST